MMPWPLAFVIDQVLVVSDMSERATQQLNKDSSAASQVTGPVDCDSTKAVA